MRISSLFILAFLVVLVSAIPSLRGGDLEQARDRYAHGEYESAATFFEKHLQSAPPSSGVYFELGQALQKSEKEVDAALAYRRTLLLDPRFSPAAEALREVNSRLGVSPTPPSWQTRLSQAIPSDFAVLLGAIAFWLGAFFLLASFVFSKNRRFFLCTAVPLLVLGFAACLFVTLADPRVSQARQAMVMNLSGTSLYKVPSEDSAEKITTLGQGSTVTILSTRGRWFHVELPGGQRGWFLQDGVALVIPTA